MRLCLSLFCFVFIKKATAQTFPGISKIRMLQVENSLAPDIIFGETMVKLNLQKQMDAYKIKGVSVAVIKDYTIDWANVMAGRIPKKKEK